MATRMLKPVHGRPVLTPQSTALIKRKRWRHQFGASHERLRTLSQHSKSASIPVTRPPSAIKRLHYEPHLTVRPPAPVWRFELGQSSRCSADGVVEFLAKDLAAAVNPKRSGYSIMETLIVGGYIEVLDRPPVGPKGGTWRVQVVDR